ncbi:unnamed protein product [Gadus morhua 'NCC']
MIEPTTLQDRRRLTKGAVATLFEWNQDTVETPRRGVWERVDQFAKTAPPEDEVDLLFDDEDYCSVPEPAPMDMSASAAESVSNEVQGLRTHLTVSEQQLWGVYADGGHALYQEVVVWTAVGDLYA